MAEIDAESFSKALYNALQEERIRKSLSDMLLPDLTKEIQALRGEIRDREERICCLQEKVAALEARTQSLEDKFDRLEQYTRRNTVRISGIPEEPTENALAKSLDALNDIFKVTPPVDCSEIDRLHRVGPPRTDGTPRNMIIKLVSYQTKRRIMDAKKNMKNAPVTDKFPNPLYVNEDLTAKRSTLCWHARRYRNQGHLKDVWTTDGNVLVRTHSGTVKGVHSLAELDSAVAAQSSSPAQPPANSHSDG